MEIELNSYIDENFFRMTLNGKSVYTYNGKLDIDFVSYEENEDDEIYPLARALARTLYLTSHMRAE